MEVRLYVEKQKMAKKKEGCDAGGKGSVSFLPKLSSGAHMGVKGNLHIRCIKKLREKSLSRVGVVV